MIPMEYRPLGNTGLTVSTLGIGIEHLKWQSKEYIAEVVREAVSDGVNYFDLVWSLPQVIEGVSQGIGNNKETHLAVHLGSSYRNGRYVKARGTRKCEETFRETLQRLDKNSVSIINLHYVKDLGQWNEVKKPRGILDLAMRLRDEGLGKIVAISTHSLDVVKLAAEHPEISSVMFQVNMANHDLQGRDGALKLCRDRGMGVVAMKPYAGGNLLKANKKVSFPEYKTGGVRAKLRIPGSMTNIKCLHYSLSQPGVSCVVSGPKTVQELQSTLNYFHSSEESRSYQSVLALLKSQGH
jgi:predicted aldo/keto reductase-like oxidoreductase